MPNSLDRPVEPTILDQSYSSSHTLLLGQLGVDTQRGLDSESVETMRSRYGANRLPQPEEKSRLRLFLEQFNNPLIYVLFAAATVTAFVSHIGDAVTIGVVVFFNAIFGYVQERRAQMRMNAVLDLTAPTARVIRDGQPRTIIAEELVVGDIVLLESGMRVPADLRIIDLQELSVDESMLTGESLPVRKSNGIVLPPDTPLGDRINMAFAGTSVRKGRARGIVTGTGSRSTVGRIARQVADAETGLSPLQERLHRFGRLMAIGIGVGIGTIFIVGILRGYEPTTMLLTAIGLAVSAIPEGLPIAVTVALSIGVFHMARHKAIVRRLNAVETLGSTTVICSDKTGTLTRNEMTAVDIIADDRRYPVTGTGYAPEGEILGPDGEKADAEKDLPLFWTLRTGLLCTESSFMTEEGKRTLVGDATEGALIVAAEKGGCAEKESQIWETSVLLPFESERMYMVARIAEGDRRFYMIKGAVERVLEQCSSELRADGVRPIDAGWVQERQRELAGRGLRVIATAYLPIGDEEPDPAKLRDCIFTGLFGIEDPPREEARQAVMDARSAGIKVVMITGDHAATAASIARQLDLSGGSEVTTVTGADLERMSDEALGESVDSVDVFARVAPEHKLRIVQQLQQKGHIVAMTGDGVNDAPALKQADIGVAMGTGTDVAKEASAMVIQDDNFATIVRAIRYGRVLFRNLQHMVLYVLSTSLGGVLTLTVAIVLGFPLPLLAIQLLWINLVTDGTSTIPLAYEKEHGDIMRERPRERSEGLLRHGMAERIISSAVVMMLGTLVMFEVALASFGFSAFDTNISSEAMTYARTAAFTTLALFQIWNVHSSRSIDHSLFRIGIFANRPLLGVTLLALLLQVAAVEMSFLHPFLHTTGLSLEHWVLTVGISLSLLFFIELRKWIGRAYRRM